MFTNLAILGAPSCRGVSANGDCRSLGSQKKPKPSCTEGLLLTSWSPFSTARYPVVPVRGGFTTMKIEAAIPGGKRTYRSEGSRNGGCSGQIRRLPTHFWTYTEGQQTISWSGSNDSWLSCNYIFFYFFDVEISYNYNCLSLILFPETYSVGDSIINYPFWGTPMETRIFPPSVAACR